MNKKTEPIQLLEQLKAWGIQTKTESHEAVFTVEQSKKIKGDKSNQGNTKNLYLRDKKKRNYLITVQQDAEIDLKLVSEKIGSGRLSFGSNDRLMEFLGVISGSVTPFSLINDEETEVTFWIDKNLLEAELIYCHPLDNTMTTAITPEDLKLFVEKTNHKFNVLDIPHSQLTN